MHLEIKTSRTILRLIREEDLDLIAELNRNKEVRKFFLDGIFSRKETEKRIKDCIALYKKCGLPYFSILNRISGEFMGRCGFTPFGKDQIELSLLIAKRFWGKGYATEILTALLNWSRSHMEIDKIIGFAPVDHKISHHLMEKCNMEYFKDGIEDGVPCKFYQIKR